VANRACRRAAPTRAAPLAFVLREDLPELLAPRPPGGAWRDELSPIAREVLAHLEGRGASLVPVRTRRAPNVTGFSGAWPRLASGSAPYH
jgi:hypothetical protein